jgi:ABC-2 type transport system ATP-binding protein
MSNSIALKIEELSYAYRHNWTLRRKLSLQKFSLEIPEGQAFGFLGHNGAGKTTTIKCILGLVKPCSGRVLAFGRNTQLPAARTPIGYLPEQPYFYDNLTVAETLTLYATLAGVDRTKRQAALHDTLERVSLLERRTSTMRSLSKGLMQRVALAQALIAAPRLLILDEPFSGLDPLGRKEFRDIFLSLKQQGVTLFMSSHILGDVEYLCDRVSIMVRGEIKGIFNLKDLPQLSDSHYLLAVRDAPGFAALAREGARNVSENAGLLEASYRNEETARRALQAAVAQRLHIERFEFVQGSLEDLFLRLVREGQAADPQAKIVA